MGRVIAPALLSLGALLLVLTVDPLGLGTWLWNLLLSVDQLGNTVLGGDPDETISSRLGRWLTDGTDGPRRALASAVCWTLDLVDPGHCVNSIESPAGGRATTE